MPGRRTQAGAAAVALGSGALNNNRALPSFRGIFEGYIVTIMG
jgi:hypothetical protein